MRKERGLTLIELAIVLIVLGILLGIGAGIVGVLIKRVKYNESKEIVNAAVEGIIGYATSAGRLPDDTQLSSAIRTLKDSYGKDLAYVYDQNLTTSSPYGFCGLTSTNITVEICPDSTCSSPTQTINNVAFIVISGNGNYNNQTAGTQGVSSATTIRVYEYGVNVDDYTGDMNRVEPYDDIVKWVTLHELQTAQGCESLTITSPTTLPVAIEDEAYTYTLRANGGRPPYTWSGTIGSGLSLSSDGTISGTVNTNTATTTGEISGCSTQINFTATVTDSTGQSVSQNFTIPVNAKPVEIITNTLPDAYEGTAYSADIDAIGGDGSYTFSGNNLPAWLTLDTNTGELSGTPPTDSGCSESVENFSISASSCSNTYTKGYSITVRDPDCGGGGGGSGGGCAPMSLSPPSGTTFNATVGTFFSQAILVSGGQPPITNITCAPTSCRGLTLSCSNTSATISGTPTSPGTCTFSVAFEDSCSTPQSISGTYAVNISCDPLTGLASSLPSGEVCYSYSGSISALGGSAPYSWTLTSGSLPLGLSFCPGNTSSTCSISGMDIYDLPGTYSFTVQVQDTCGQIVSQSFSISVNYPAGNEGSEIQDCVGDGGIDIDEAFGVSLYYKVNNSGSCLSITNSTRFNLGNEYYIYTDSGCSNQLCVLNFCQLWDVEWANGISNCRVRIDSNCNLSDI